MTGQGFGAPRAPELNGVEDTIAATGSAPGTENESGPYDNEGNITKTVAGTGGTSTYFGYNAADELCWSGPVNGPSCTTPSSSDTTYSSDADGNLTGADNGFTAGYDAANVTSSFTGTIDTGTGGTSSATYNDYGQTARTTLGGTSFTDTILGLASSSTGAGGTRTDYTRLPSGQLLSMRTGTVTGYNPTTTTNNYYSNLDRQQSVLSMTDANGNYSAQYAYNPYGTTLAQTGTNAATNRNRWISAYTDTETGLYHLGARYYSTKTIRFLQTDPKNHPLDLTQQDTYSYASGDPNDNTYLTGWWSWGDCPENGVSGLTR